MCVLLTLTPCHALAIQWVLSSPLLNKKRKEIHVHVLRSHRVKTLLLHTFCALGGQYMLDPEASCFLKEVAEQLSFCWNKQFLSWWSGWKFACNLLQYLTLISGCVGPEACREVQRKWTMVMDCLICSCNAWVLFSFLVICYNIHVHVLYSTCGCSFIIVFFVVK